MKLKLKQFLSKLINTPLVVETGTDGIWCYRKWSDGRMEAWASILESYAITGTVGNQYYCNKVYDISSLHFQSINNILVTGRLSGAYFGSKVETNSLTSLTISARANSSQTGDLTHFIYIMGDWASVDPTTSNWTITGLSQNQMTKEEIQDLIEGSGNQFKEFDPSEDIWMPPDLT